MLEKISEKQPIVWEIYFFFFFSFYLGSGFSLYPSQWVEKLRNNTEIPERTLASKAFMSMGPEFLCQQSMTECI